MVTELKNNLKTIYNELNEKLIPENIKKDVQILNVTGTLEIDQSSASVAKVFTNTDDLDNADGNTGDYAAVFSYANLPMEVNDVFNTVYCPETVVLDTAVTSNLYGNFEPVNSSDWFDASAFLTATKFSWEGYTDNGSFSITYTSTDGKTYTRTSSAYEVSTHIDLKCTRVQTGVEQFLLVLKENFGGFYEYRLTEPNLYGFTNPESNYLMSAYRDTQCIKLPKYLNLEAAVILVTESVDSGKVTKHQGIPIKEMVSGTIYTTDAYNTTEYNGYVFVSVGSDNRGVVTASPHMGTGTIKKIVIEKNEVKSVTEITTDEVKAKEVIVDKTITTNKGYLLEDITAGTDVVLVGEVGGVGCYIDLYTTTLPVTTSAPARGMQIVYQDYAYVRVD